MLDRESSTELLIEKMQPAALITRWQKWAYRLMKGLIGGLIIGLIGGLIIGLMEGLIKGLIGGLICGLIGSILGLIFGLMQGLLGGLETIEPVEEISMSRERKQEILRALRKWLSGGLSAGLILGLYGWLIEKLIERLIEGLIIGLIVGLVVGLIEGIKVDIQTHLKPNQGIKSSMKNMVIIGTIALVIAVPFKFFLDHLLASIVTAPILSQILTNSLACLIWFSFGHGGGNAFIQHLALRFVLAWNGYAPFRYDLLLNYCTERLLLQRIGGRYCFMHKLLQDHFAKMNLE
jgi:hypothetical protein